MPASRTTSRTIRRKPIKTSRKKRSTRNAPRDYRIPFVPDWLQAFVARRFVDGVALFFTLGGVFAVLALVSYNVNDPSFNTAGAVDGIANWMGAFGAGVSDIVVQTLGGAGFFIGGIVAIWGIRLFNRQTVSPFLVRLIALMVGALAASVAVARLER